MPIKKNTAATTTRHSVKTAALPKGYQGPAFETAEKRIIFCDASPDNPDSFGPCFRTNGKRQRVVHDDVVFRGDRQAAIDDLNAFGDAHLKRIQ